MCCTPLLVLVSKPELFDHVLCERVISLLEQFYLDCCLQVVFIMIGFHGHDEDDGANIACY